MKLNQIKRYRATAYRHLRSSERSRKISSCCLFVVILLTFLQAWLPVIALAVISVCLGVHALISLRLFDLNYELYKANTKYLCKKIHKGSYEKKSEDGMKSRESLELTGFEIGSRIHRTPSSL